MAERAVVKAVLRESGTVIESPIMDREQADKDLAEVAKSRDGGETINLSWLNAEAHDIVAAHLEVRKG